MSASQVPDYYEVLQVSPRADSDTIQRIFRHLAKRLHPDNTESGDTERFRILLEAFHVLSDPERRARYDVRLEAAQRSRERLQEEAAAPGAPLEDRQMQQAALKLLYTARRTDARRPGLGAVELERLLDCPEQHLQFHLWYLRESGWIRREEDGSLSITVSGVDQVLSWAVPERDRLQFLTPAAG